VNGEPTEASFRKAFDKALRQTNVKVPRDAAKQWYPYWQLLCRWNKKINLTAITDLNGAIAKHFIDSAALLPATKGAATLLDVGSGAGFPGLVIAGLRPDIQVHLVESIKKKAHFLTAARRELGLENVTVYGKRVEELPPEMTFDLVTGRAVAQPEKFARLIQGRIAQNGRLALFLSSTDSVEVNGFESVEKLKYALPFGNEKRTIAVFRQTGK
jgi:16S rRNA (guanine527-N7)-methyltransferase